MKKAFTLIELLVVVSIIALLAAILLPSLSRAREQAKAASCLSNMHNIGLNLHMYVSENKNYLPTAYSYIDGNSSGNGYMHWTASLDPEDYTDSITAKKYPKNSKQYVCPSHTPGGWAPSNFTAWRVPDPPSGQVSQDSGGSKDDRQAARLSYVANEAVMPRKKYSSVHDSSTPPGTSNLRQVEVDNVMAANNTILAGEFSNSANCIWGSSVGGGAAYKSHRPTNGVKASTGVFDGENYATGTQVFKLTLSEAMSAIDAVLADKGAATTNQNISYINPNSHKSGSNYLFVDGHSAKHTLEETLDPGNYMWGRKMYSCIDAPTIQDNP